MAYYEFLRVRNVLKNLAIALVVVFLLAAGLRILHASGSIVVGDDSGNVSGSGSTHVTRVTLPTGKTLDVAIPVGVEDGKQIRLRGQGQPGARGQAGDALVTIHYAPHPLFKVEGRDLRLDLPITLYEAVLGGKVRAPTLDG